MRHKEEGLNLLFCLDIFSLTKSLVSKVYSIIFSLDPPGLLKRAYLGLLSSVLKGGLSRGIHKERQGEDVNICQGHSGGSEVAYHQK